VIHGKKPVFRPPAVDYSVTRTQHKGTDELR
jgi:hypothetical protein